MNSEQRKMVKVYPFEILLALFSAFRISRIELFLFFTHLRCSLLTRNNTKDSEDYLKEVLVIVILRKAM